MPSFKKVYTTNDKNIWFITWLFLVLFNVSGESSSFLLFLFALILLFLTNFKFEAYPYHIMTMQFCLYCYASAFWALNGRFCLEKGNTIFLSLVCIYIFYSYYSKLSNIMILVKIIMWAGYTVIFYTYYFYGIDSVIAAEQSQRLNSEFANVNSIGMLTAIVIIISYYFYLFEKKDTTIFLTIPAFFIIGATQSRKAIVMLVFGITMLYIFKQIHGRKRQLPWLKIFTFFVIGIAVLLALGQTSMFSGLNNRLSGMIASITGVGYVDHSTSLRALYKEIGWGQFMETPLQGIGIGNARILVGRAVGYDTYLHDNYAEIACGGGVLGLISYYSIYLYILIGELRYVKKESSAVLVEVWVLSKLLTDYGAVTYYSKIPYFYLMFFYLHLIQMQKKYPVKKKRKYFSL